MSAVYWNCLCLLAHCSTCNAVYKLRIFKQTCKEYCFFVFSRSSVSQSINKDAFIISVKKTVHFACKQCTL